MKEQIEINNSLIAKFEALLLKKLSLENEIEDLNNEKTKIYVYAKNIILNEVDENGKKKYSNEDMRNFALIKILENDNKYNTLEKDYKNYNIELNRIKAEIEITSKKITINLKNSDLLIALNEVKNENN